VTDNDKEVLNEFVEFAVSFYGDLNETQNLPNVFIVPETQPTTNNSNQNLEENQLNSSHNNAPSNLTLLVNELNNENSSNNLSSFASVLKDPSFVNSSKIFKKELLTI